MRRSVMYPFTCVRLTWKCWPGSWETQRPVTTTGLSFTLCCRMRWSPRGVSFPPVRTPAPRLYSARKDSRSGQAEAMRKRCPGEFIRPIRKKICATLRLRPCPCLKRPTPKPISQPRSIYWQMTGRPINFSSSPKAAGPRTSPTSTSRPKAS